MIGGRLVMFRRIQKGEEIKVNNSFNKDIIGNKPKSFYEEVQSVQNTQKRGIMKDYLDSIKSSIMKESKEGFYHLKDDMSIFRYKLDSDSAKGRMARALKDESVSIEELEVYLEEGLGNGFTVKTKEDRREYYSSEISYSCSVLIEWDNK